MNNLTEQEIQQEIDRLNGLIAEAVRNNDNSLIIKLSGEVANHYRDLNASRGEKIISEGTSLMDDWRSGSLRK